jgi:prephenate dehydratase
VSGSSKSAAPATATPAVVADSSSPRVAFQGRRGAFSETAVRRLFPAGAIPVECRDFETLFSAIGENRADYIVAPLENTLAGAVYQCYDLLYDAGLSIIDETVLQISHCLIAVPQAKLEDIREVESHPVALAQCERFFANYPRILRKVADDTAGSVQAVINAGDRSRAAIAGSEAAKLYGGAILLEHIEDFRNNFTRFALLSPAVKIHADNTTSTIALTIPNRPGSLYHALAPFANSQIDLLSLVSRPIKGTPWQYRFFLDVAASKQKLEASVAGPLHAMNAELRYLGSCNTSREQHK